MNTLDKYGIKKDEWDYFGRYDQAPFSASFWVYWYDESTGERLGIPKLDGRLIRIGGHQSFKKEDVHKLNLFAEKICDVQDVVWRNSFKKTVLEILDEHKNLLPLLKNNPSDGKLLDKFVKSCRRVALPWLVVGLFSNYLDEYLRQKSKGFDIDLTVVMKNTPYKISPLIQPHKEALEIKKMLKEAGLLDAVKKSVPAALDEIRKNASIWQKIRDHIRNYEWLRTHHFSGEPLTVESFLREVLEIEEKKNINQKIDIPEELRFLVDFFWELSFLRDNIVAIFNRVAYAARPLLTEIGRGFKLSYEEVLLLTPKEINKYLKAGAEPEKTSLMKREKGYCILIKDGEEVIIDNTQELMELTKALVPQLDMGTTEIKGVGASKGRAVGTVKVFLVPKGMERMQKGDVLVTSMTTPDFVPLMQKAVAIVTDLGGSLSHAAIVSRELGKPCVIDTKVATQVLKDGDIVEVDADKGIVMKIK